MSRCGNTVERNEKKKKEETWTIYSLRVPYRYIIFINNGLVRFFFLLTFLTFLGGHKFVLVFQVYFLFFLVFKFWVFSWS